MCKCMIMFILCVLIYARAYARVHTLVAHTCVYFVCVYLWVCARVSVLISPLYVWLRVTTISDSFVRAELSNGRFGLCSLWTQYTGDLKTNL